MKAKMTVSSKYRIGRIDNRIYGSFIEHLGRAVYGGIYEPGHETADEDGFRGDVLDLVKKLDVPVVRYPGGNFVSSYNWEDSVGPVADRPKRLDLAWKSTEPNEVGLQEFARWADKAETDLMMAINLGTRGVEEASNLVEYCNQRSGSYWSDLRKKHGKEEPYNIRLWCLGNEMDGPWQVGQKTPYEYGRLANETAKALKLFDKDLELVVCGSSSNTMPTFPEWEREVLDLCYENVDYVSMHIYLKNDENDLERFLAAPTGMDSFIETVVHTCDFIKAKKRSKKTVNISFDEWNVWFHSNQQDQDIYKNTPWKVGPALLEDVYTFEDALVVGLMLNSLIRHSDRVKIACLAQLVNVIAPIMTDNGGTAWCQTIYYPYYYASHYGRGTALQLVIDSPTYENDKYGTVPYLDATAVHNEEKGELALFVVNRNSGESLSLAAEVSGFSGYAVKKQMVMVHRDNKAVNTRENPDNVVPAESDALSFDGAVLSGEVPPLSWNFILLGK